MQVKKTSRPGIAAEIHRFNGARAAEVEWLMREAWPSNHDFEAEYDGDYTIEVFDGRGRDVVDFVEPDCTQEGSDGYVDVSGKGRDPIRVHFYGIVADTCDGPYVLVIENRYEQSKVVVTVVEMGYEWVEQNVIGWGK